MAINHNIAHYVIGGAALMLASYGTLAPAQAPVHETAIHEVQKPSRLDWPALGEDKTAALGESLKGLPPGKVTIYCAQSRCHGLMLDFDDAMQIAGWKSDFEERQVESENERGVFVGPPGQDAENLAAALTKVGFDATIVGISDEYGQTIDGVGIIIGKSGK
jgi:hypothetical protein